jgi:CBS domain-containing protein
LFFPPLGQAIKIVMVSFLDADKYYVPIMILVMDEMYNLRGILTRKGILEKIWKEKGSREMESHAGKIMTPTKIFVRPDDLVTKAASLMLENNLDLLPVSDEKNKFVGLIRMMEIFDELINVVLKK